MVHAQSCEDFPFVKGDGSCFTVRMEHSDLASVFFPSSTNTVDERKFFALTEKTGRCWRWLGAHSRGYGQYRVAGRYARAHRVAWVLVNGPIPAGLVIDHKCGNTMCVNPAHLEPCTASENSKRAARSRTHCRAGHLLMKKTIVPGKVRACATCLAIRLERSKAKQAEESLPARVLRGEPLSCENGHSLSSLDVNETGRWRRVSCCACAADRLAFKGARRRSYYAKNRDKFHERDSMWRAKHPSYFQSWRDRHPGYHNAYMRLKKAGEPIPPGFSKQFELSASGENR